MAAGLEDETVKCVICKNGVTKPGRATVTLTRGDLTLVVKGVPAEVCANCGEEYVDEEVTRRILQVAEDAAKAGVQVDVRDYVAA
jgi:YgiT-type zinc finger domain-containing protein